MNKCIQVKNPFPTLIQPCLFTALFVSITISFPMETPQKYCAVQKNAHFHMQLISNLFTLFLFEDILQSIVLWSLKLKQMLYYIGYRISRYIAIQEVSLLQLPCLLKIKSHILVYIGGTLPKLSFILFVMFFFCLRFSIMQSSYHAQTFLQFEHRQLYYRLVFINLHMSRNSLSYREISKTKKMTMTII